MSHGLTGPQPASAPATAGPSAKGWPDDTVLLLLTYSKMEGYVPEILENLDLFWPDRPRTMVVTDGALQGANVISIPDADFASLLSGAVGEVRKRAPGLRYVFLLLEDLCPLWQVDVSVIDRIQTFLRERDGKYMCHFWRNRNNVPWHDGRWDMSNALNADGLRVVQMPKYYRCYNALTASFWDLDHLQSVLRSKVESGMLDPWRFERPIGPEQPQHYLVDGAWPTVRHGFYHKGRPNHMIAKREMPPSPLLSRLLREHAA